MRLDFNQLNGLSPAGFGARASLLGLALCGVSSRALATEPAAADLQQDKLACSRSFEQAQRLRNATQYVAANQEVLNCANPKCGEALFKECTKLYTELQTAIPSVVFEAHDAGGKDVVDVTVTVDGNTLTDQLDGKPIPVDPGSHTFTFSPASGPAMQKTVLIRAGEKYRQVLVVLDIGSAAPANAPPVQALRPAPLDRPAASASSRHVPVASYVLGGVGVLALGSFATFRLIGANEYHNLEQGCSPICLQSDIDTVKQKYLISNISLGVGAAAFVGAIVVYAAQPHGSGAETALLVSPTLGGLSARAVTKF